jgi:CRP-like cAMP-binding protein
MLNRFHDPNTLLRNKMERFVELSDRDRRALSALPIRVVAFGRDQEVVREADPTTRSCLLVQGLACSSKVLSDGRRQIMAMHFAGDIPDLHSLEVGLADATITTMVPSTVGIILHEHLRDLRINPNLFTALWRWVVADGVITREWVANLGQRQAIVRTAHLLSELSVRMRALGAAGAGSSYDLPVTQQELGDTLGLSTVHVNRCLQVLRRQRLISWVGTTLTILDQDGLEEAGDFSDDYLHFGQRTAKRVAVHH